MDHGLAALADNVGCVRTHVQSLDSPTYFLTHPARAQHGGPFDAADTRIGADRAEFVAAIAAQCDVAIVEHQARLQLQLRVD